MKRILIAAGGTGGHLFPAIAVVEELKELYGSEIDFQFFGRNDKIEGTVVPKIGYLLHNTNLTGLSKLISLNTVKIPFKVLSDVLKLIKIIKIEKIDAVLCAGAYLSYPAGLAASLCKKKLFLMESNINPGKTIKMLSNRADVIFTTFEETKKYFRDNNINKIKNFGNPVRKEFYNFTNFEENADVNNANLNKNNEALNKFGLTNNTPVVFILGGSLGAVAINNAVLNSLEQFANSDLQIIWQTGSSNKIENKLPANVKLVHFIDDMFSAYSAADLVVARSGATTVAELCAVGKPSILVPLPSASNNEQFFNAKYLEDNDAAILIKNSDISEKLFESITMLINAPSKLSEMSVAAKKLAKPYATEMIAKEIFAQI